MIHNTIFNNNNNKKKTAQLLKIIKSRAMIYFFLGALSLKMKSQKRIQINIKIQNYILLLNLRVSSNDPLQTFPQLVF